MKFLGEPEPYRYRLFLGASRMAFGALWHPTKWDSGFDNVWLLAEDPLEPVRRALEAAGYEYELVGNRDVGPKETWFPRGAFPQALSADELRGRVCAEIQAGRPAIAFGLMSGAAVVAGYQDGGQTLVGWSMFDEKNPPERDPLGYLLYRNWPELTEAVLFLREKRERPSLEDTLRQALLWAAQGYRTPKIGEYACGEAVYDLWAARLEDDALWSAEDPPALGKAGDAHFLATLTVAEGRAFGAEMPERLAELRPEAAPDLHVAEGSYYLMHDLVWRLWQTAEGTVGPDFPGRLSDAGVRRELARLVRLERDLDANAATHLERALLALGASPADFPPASEAEQQAVAAFAAREARSGAYPGMVRHEGTNGTWVEGTPALGWAKGRDCTFVGALEAALAPTSCPYSYADLMGYSGLAFRSRWFHNPEGAATTWGTSRWHPISPHGEGPDEITALSRATGWRLRREALPDDRNDPAYQHVITDLVLSVNDGLPAIIGLNTDLATVYGYHIWSMNLILRDYQRPDQQDVRVQANDPGFHAPVILLDAHVEPLEPRDALLESLRLTLGGARRQAADGFLYGPDALQAWEGDLEGYETYTEAERNLLFLTNWWTLMHLADGRQAAVTYLEANGDLVTGLQQDALARALTAYRAEAQALRAFCDANLDFIQWHGGMKQVTDWDADTRRAQADLLAQCVGWETEALAACEEVVGE
jgi:hypothetical protein